jgi:hypothetical protein
VDEQKGTPTAGKARTQALIYASNGELSGAEAAFRQAIRLSPDEIANYADLSLLLLLKGDIAGVSELVNKGLALDQRNTTLHLIAASVSYQEGKSAETKAALERILEWDPDNIIVNYKLAVLDMPSIDERAKKRYLLKVIAAAPDNLAPRLQLAELLARSGEKDSSLSNLLDIRKIAPVFHPAMEAAYANATARLKASQVADALPHILQFRHLIEATPAYANGMARLDLPSDVAGNLKFSSKQGTKTATETVGLDRISFADVSALVGFTESSLHDITDVAFAVDYYGGDDSYRIYVSYVRNGSDVSEYHLWHRVSGTFTESTKTSGIDHKARERSALFLDFDNDGHRDLFIVTTKGNMIYQNLGDGRFSRTDAGVKGNGKGLDAMSADFDQDGDLDVYVVSEDKNALFRNNGDGHFSDEAAAMQLDGSPGRTIAADYGDLDNDGDLDIVLLSNPDGLQIYNNQRRSHFQDISATATGTGKYAGTVLTTGDYNNDGMIDILVAGGDTQKFFLLANSADQRFTVDPGSPLLSSVLQDAEVRDIALLDFDNDGYQDILVATDGNGGKESGLVLFHNDLGKGFSNVTHLIAGKPGGVYRIETMDFNFDGDEDIFLVGASGLQLLRNDGGSLNRYVHVELVGLSYGSSKNNRLGIGAQVELNAGDLYQHKTMKKPYLIFGVGGRDSLESLRIVWPNGVPQVVVDPTLEERILEEAKLKGSCPFLYTWNGKNYEFVKDMMWRSILGMPLDIVGKDTIYAFPDASREYLMIPGEKLQPRDGLYSIKITEELWESVFFDQAELIAIDHPDSVDVFVDERFKLPPFPGRELYQVSSKQLPVSAIDNNGNNVLPELTAYDFTYASTFSPGKYQGLTEDHELILDLGNAAQSTTVQLFLRGWVLPGDASISVAMAQNKKYKQRPPKLQVVNQLGQWETVINDLGFPLGKDKTVIADLTGKFLTRHDRRIRISTNMQIYWDHIFFATGKVQSTVKMHDLKMVDATLNYRGYSASYNKGGPFGPHWFDYDRVSTGQQWRDLTGYYTRYGDVKPLLLASDDKYIIANSGDEISIHFDAKAIPSLPPGWKRDFLIYSVGWVKDGDLNTAHGQTVEPLPFHAMPSYPYGNSAHYPTDPDHVEYRKKYNTRYIDTERFKNALKPTVAEMNPDL